MEQNVITSIRITSVVAILLLVFLVFYIAYLQLKLLYSYHFIISGTIVYLIFNYNLTEDIVFIHLLHILTHCVYNFVIFVINTCTINYFIFFVLRLVYPIEYTLDTDTALKQLQI